MRPVALKSELFVAQISDEQTVEDTFCSLLARTCWIPGNEFSMPLIHRSTNAHGQNAVSVLRST